MIKHKWYVEWSDPFDFVFVYRIIEAETEDAARANAPYPVTEVRLATEQEITEWNSVVCVK